jgi:hypothetical protein
MGRTTAAGETTFDGSGDNSEDDSEDGIGKKDSSRSHEKLSNANVMPDLRKPMGWARWWNCWARW